MFTRRSRTAVPQSLTYMIDDVARRHGGLRLGAAGCYLRSEDAALLIQVAADRRLSGLSLRSVAPTVLISPYLVSRVLDELRAAGYAPVQEDGGGGLVIARTRAFRAPPRRNTLSLPAFTDAGRGLTAPRLAAAVEALRRGDAVARTARRAPATVRAAGPTDSHAHTNAMAVLQQAIRDKAPVWVGYVDAHGSTTSRLLRPVSIGGGYLRAQDERTEMLHTFALHRITAAAVEAEARLAPCGCGDAGSRARPRTSVATPGRARPQNAPAPKHHGCRTRASGTACMARLRRRPVRRHGTRTGRCDAGPADHRQPCITGRRRRTVPRLHLARELVRSVNTSGHWVQGTAPDGRTERVRLDRCAGVRHSRRDTVHPTRRRCTCDRRPADRPVRQDPAPRGRPPGCAQLPDGDRALRRAGALARARAHVPVDARSGCGTPAPPVTTPSRSSTRC